MAREGLTDRLAQLYILYKWFVRQHLEYAIQTYSPYLKRHWASGKSAVESNEIS